MSYYYATTVTGSDFESVIAKTVEALKTEGFGVLTDIDIQAVMKEKLGADLLPYRILGACNPQFAFKALENENKIGTMLPCNVIVRTQDDGSIEVAAVDPQASMQAVSNEALGSIAEEVGQRLLRVVQGLGDA